MAAHIFGRKVAVLKNALAELLFKYLLFNRDAMSRAQQIMKPYASLFKIYKQEFLDVSVSKNLIHPNSLALAGDGTPVLTSHRERKKRICDCKEKGILNCDCNRYYSQPDCDIGWDSSNDRWYHGYDLYMLVDSQSDLPVFPLFSCASKHDSHGFLHTFFRMKSYDRNLQKSFLNQKE